MAPGRVGYRALLSRPNFRAIWTAGGLTLAVVPVMVVVLVWTATQAFPDLSGGARTTGVAYALSLLGLSATVPTLLAALVSGALADRWPRRRLMQSVNLVEIVGVLGALAVLALRPGGSVRMPLGGPALPVYLILLFPCWSLVSAGATLFRPALNASMPRVVAPAELGTANSSLFALGLGAGVVGALLAPVLLATTGAVAALSVPLLYLAVAQGAIAGIEGPLDPADPPPPRPFRHDLWEGYRYLFARRGLLAITFAALAINFLAAVSFVELGLYVTLVLGIGQPIFLGALYAGASLGAAVGTLIVPRLHFEPHAGKYLAVLAILQGATVVALAVLRWYPGAVLDLFFYGLLPGMSGTVFFALVQATVRNDMLGRVLAADEVGSYALVPVGQYVGGAVTLLVGVSTTFLLGGIGILAAGGALALLPVVRALGFRPNAPSDVPPGALGIATRPPESTRPGVEVTRRSGDTV